MLQQIRSNLQGIVARVIIGLLTIPFVLWGVDAFFLDSGNPDIAKVNGEPISELELNQQVYRQRQQMLARMGDKIDASQIDEAMLRGPVLERLIQQRLFESAADSGDLFISGAMVDRLILQQSEFQDDGVFSPQRFEALVRGSGMTPVHYKEAMRKQLLVSQLLSGYAATEFITQADLELAARISGQKRDVEYALMTVEQAAQKVSIDEEEVNSYYDAHPEEFVTQETVSVEYIQLRLEDFYPEIGESEVRAAYDVNVADMELGSRRRAAHILLELGDGDDDEPVRQQIETIASRIAAGEEFSDLAREYSDDIGSRQMGGDLGYSDGTAFPDIFESTLAELELGEVSAAIKTDAGWHLVKLVEVEQAEVPTYESLREDILSQLQLDKAEPLYAVKLEELKDISFNAPDLTSVAEQLALETKTSDMFSRAGMATGLFAEKRLLAEAFTSVVLDQAVNSEVVEISPIMAVVLRLAERKPSEQIPFAEVNERLTERLRTEKTTAFMVQRAEDIHVAVQGGQLLSVMADNEGLEYAQFREIGRDNIAEMPREIATVAFQLSPPAEGGSNYAVKALADGNVVVVAVNKVAPGSLADIDTASQENMRRLLARYRGERAIEGYRASLRETADIKMM